MSFWPLPGKRKDCLKTLSIILSKIQESELSLDELASWVSYKLGSKVEWTKNSIRVTMLYTKLAKVEDGIIHLTEAGQRFLETNDKKIVVNCLLENIWGIREILLLLKKRPMSMKELYEGLRELGASWEKIIKSDSGSNG